MKRLVVLHTNDIHGAVDGLARVATLVEEVRAQLDDVPVLYLDAGDVEDPSNALSSMTKGVAMIRLLGAATCDAAVVGNAALLRYGPGALEAEAEAASFPHLLANVRRPDGGVLPGVHPTALLERGGICVGLIGVTSAAVATPDRKPYEHYFGLPDLPLEPLVRELAADLRGEGADVVILLSHLGLPEDRELAPRLDGVVDAIVGGHSHDLLPSGERHGRVVIAQAGDFARHFGRLELAIESGRAEVVSAATAPVADDVPPHPRVLAEVAAIEREVDAHLDEVIGEVAEELDWAADHECGVGALMADVLRRRMDADVGVAALGPSFRGPLPAGPLTRRTLLDACPAMGGVPGVTQMTGRQLHELVARGLEPERMAARPHPLRGNPQGVLHLSGAEIRDGRLWVGGEPLDPARIYRVAGSDWELDTYAGYADPAWGLSVEYDGVVQLPEAVEEYLAGGPVHAPGRRIHGSLAQAAPA